MEPNDLSPGLTLERIGNWRFSASYFLPSLKSILIQYGSPTSLAHEIAHMIGLKVNRKTCELDAWKIAKSFLKPELFSQIEYDFSKRTYLEYAPWKWDTYVNRHGYKLAEKFEAEGEDEHGN